MRVIICDDHAIVREGIRLLLGADPSIEVVAEVADGSALMQLLSRVDAEIVILDLKMEGTSGLEVLEQLRDSYRGPAAVVLTMHDDEQHLRRAVELGARGYVLKRSGGDELIRALQAVAGGAAHVDSHLTGALVTLATEQGLQRSLRDEEIELLRLLAEELDTAEIMERQGWSENTAKGRIRALYRALGVSRRSDAVAAGLRRGLID